MQKYLLSYIREHTYVYLYCTQAIYVHYILCIYAPEYIKKLRIFRCKHTSVSVQLNMYYLGIIHTYAYKSTYTHILAHKHMHTLRHSHIYTLNEFLCGFSNLIFLLKFIPELAGPEHHNLFRRIDIVLMFFYAEIHVNLTLLNLVLIC